MVKLNLIGVNGKIGSGKDTFADYLVKEHNFIKLSMSDILKDACAKLFDIDIEYFHDRILKENEIPNYVSSNSNIKITPRYIMRTVGTELTRKYFPNHFIKIMNNKINKILNEVKEVEEINNINNNIIINIIIPDIRFIDEYDMIKSFNGYIVKITSNNITGKNKNVILHSSDTQKIKYDYIIFNPRDITYYDNIKLFINNFTK